MMPGLAETNTVVAVDLRGAGHSDCPQGGYDKATMAADVHGVMQALGFERYAVCGHDIGAMVALALACTHRGAVTRLAVLDASQPGWSEWEVNCAKPALWHFAFHQKRDLPERLLFGREYDYVSLLSTTVPSTMALTPSRTFSSSPGPWPSPATHAAGSSGIAPFRSINAMRRPGNRRSW